MWSEQIITLIVVDVCGEGEWGGMNRGNTIRAIKRSRVLLICPTLETCEGSNYTRYDIHVIKLIKSHGECITCRRQSTPASVSSAQL